LFLNKIYFKVAVEAIQNIRTVVQLSKEEHFYNEYSKLLDMVYRYDNFSF
jgi:hypothetical protein